MLDLQFGNFRVITLANFIRMQGYPMVFTVMVLHAGRQRPKMILTNHVELSF